MKRFFSLVLFAVLLLSCCVFQTSAVEDDGFVPRVVDFSLTAPIIETANDSAGSRATGLIMMYALDLSATGNTLTIRAETYCNAVVVKSGFKDFVVQRKKATDSKWSDYYDYGDLYIDTYAASINTTLVVESGYQYRLSCKHYAKKSLLVTQNISNTSNVVAV